MKILHIALTDDGGAGKGMMGLHHALLAQGIDSRVLVAKKRSDDNRVVAMQPNLHIWSTHKWLRILQRVACRMGVCLNGYDRWHRRIYKIRKHHPVFFTQPLSQYDILAHPLAKEADILHLHFVAEFVDYPSFFRNAKKPIVWTIRDESIGLGGFHFQETKQQLGAPYASLEEAFLTIKREAIASCHSLHLVSLSNMAKAFCQHTHYLASLPCTIIPNCIDTACFQPLSKKEARQQLALPSNAIVLSFVSCHLGERRKGFQFVVEALKALNDKRIHLLCVGKRDANIADDANVHFFGSVNDSTFLSTIYNASDFFVNASTQETFGKTLVEALYCGTPVITTPVGIAPEIINAHNGVLFSSESVEALVAALKMAFHSTFHPPTAIRQEAIQRFAPERVAYQYVQLYTSLLKEGKQ